MISETIVCCGCGKKFKPKRKWQKYCCTNCKTRTNNRKYRSENREQYNLKLKEYYRIHKENIKEQRKEYIKNYKIKNLKKLKEYHKEYRLKNKDKIKEYYIKNKKKINKLSEQRKQERLKTEPELKMRLIMKNMVRRVLGKMKGGKSSSKVLGYTKEDLIAHIESNFQEGMSWDNYGEWHIDHKIPLVSFTFISNNEIDYEIVKKANSLENLQPLWAIDNLRKGRKQ